MQTAQRKKSLVSLVSSTRLKLQMEKVSEVAFFGSHQKQKVFPFFCFFFFLFFCFVVLHTQSSSLEAASVKGFSLFAVTIFFKCIFSSLCIEAPKSRLGKQGLGSCFLNVHAWVESSLLVHQLCSVVLTANQLQCSLSF